MGATQSVMNVIGYNGILGKLNVRKIISMKLLKISSTQQILFKTARRQVEISERELVTDSRRPHNNYRPKNYVKSTP